MPRVELNGYCWPQSAVAGDDVALHASRSGVGVVDVEVARVGAAREVVWSASVEVGDHAVPPGASERGCGWPVAATIPVDPAWRSGYHEVRLTTLDGERTRVGHAFFVVRPARASPDRMLLALSTNTWHAYNDFGGRNLYTGATQVSMQRPMARGYLHKPPGAGRRVASTAPPDPQLAAHVGYLRLNQLSPWAGSAGWPDWEAPFVAWAEAAGYPIDVVTNADLADHAHLLDGPDRYPLLLSVGHDEYWSAAMRDTVETYIAQGGNVAFLSGNTAFWQVRLEDGEGATSGARPAPVVVGYKGRFRDDPVYDSSDRSLLTSIWSDYLIGRPENHMTGVSFSRGGYHRIGKRVTQGAGGYTIHRPRHWIFDGTGLDYGDVLGAGATIVGYECDGCDFTVRDGLPYPTHADGTPETFEILGTAPAAHFTRETAARPPRPDEPSEIEFIASRLYGTRDPEAVERIAHGHAVLGTWTSPGGGVVVTTGCTDWAHGLAGRDPQVERITHNILGRLGANPRTAGPMTDDDTQEGR